MRRKKIVTAATAAGILMAVVCADCSSGRRARTGRMAAGQTTTGQTVAGQTTVGQTVPNEDPEAAPGSRSNERITENIELPCADQFSVDYYDGGYPMVTIRDSGRYLVVPGGKLEPSGLPGGVTVVRQPLKDVYLATMSVTDLSCNLDGADQTTLSRTDASGWYIEEAGLALGDGKMLYADRYSIPDYKRVLSMPCDLAIEPVMVYHSPKVKEQLEQLGIPVLVERSSYESHSPGRMERLKLYAVLLDQEGQAKRCSDDQVRQLLLVMNQENTRRIVTLFHASSSGYVNVRKFGDYVAEIIALAKGTYVPQGLAGNENALSTMSMWMENFYAAIRDVNYIIYSSTINGELDSLNQLLDGNSLLADFKAMEEGNVWYTEKSLFQGTTGLGDMILNIHRVLTRKKLGGLRYMHRLRQGAFEDAFPPDKDIWRPHGLPEKGVMPMPKGTHTKCSISFALLAATICVLFIWNINSGSVYLSMRETSEILLRRTGEDTSYCIMQGIRLLRISSAAILSGALSISSFLLQTFSADPIAGPFVLGISFSAKLVISLAVVVLLGRGTSISSTGMILTTFTSSMISMGFVPMISDRVKEMPMLVICGVMISYIYSAIMDFVVILADDTNTADLHNWSIDSFSGTSWEDVRVVTVVIFLILLLVFPAAKPVDTYQMGETYAQSTGANILRFGAALTLLSSILLACVTALAGSISFVSIVVPHPVKGLFKTVKPILMILGCFLGGTMLYLFCDLAARTVSALTGLSIGSMAAVLDTPIVVYVVVYNRKSMW